jgi:hypothetical protein
MHFPSGAEVSGAHRRGGRALKSRQLYTPTAVVAFAAVVLQIGLLVTRPRGTERAALDVLRIGYEPVPAFAIGALDQPFVERPVNAAFAGATLGALERGRPRRRVTRSAPAPQPAEPSVQAPSRPDAPPPAPPENVVVRMELDRTTGSPGDELNYLITGTNTSGHAVARIFRISTHVPRFTSMCQDRARRPCTTPGTYDGSSSDPDEIHAFPASTQQRVVIPPHATVTILDLRVQISLAAPAGTTLINHAHVDAVGDDAGPTTLSAPIGVVR